MFVGWFQGWLIGVIMTCILWVMVIMWIANNGGGER